MNKEELTDISKETKKTHAMFPKQARENKLGGHESEKDFNYVFGNKEATINYSGPSSDCIILDKIFLGILIEKLGIKGESVSLKGGNTIQIHLGLLPELTNMVIWNKNLCRKKMPNGKICTTSIHGIPFRKQKQILKSYSFWDKYLAKGEILCYRDKGNKWIFFNMEEVINFIINNFTWRILPTGRIKGDCKGKQYITYEYRAEEHKLCFVLGAHGGKKGKEFIDLLRKNIPNFEEIRVPNRKKD